MGDDSTQQFCIAFLQKKRVWSEKSLRTCAAQKFGFKINAFDQARSCQCIKVNPTNIYHVGTEGVLSDRLYEKWDLELSLIFRTPAYVSTKRKINMLKYSISIKIEEKYE